MLRAFSSALLGTLCLAATFNMIDSPRASAQVVSSDTSEQVPLTALRGIRPETGRSNAAGGNLFQDPTAKGFAKSGTPGVDSIPNWRDQFVANGFDDNNKPQSVWPYTMVGAPPESGRTTVFSAPVIPVTLEALENPDITGGASVVAVRNGTPMRSIVSADVLGATLNSPVFQPWFYTSGIGQINDQLLRAEFWNRIHPGHSGGDGDDESDNANGWHNILAPRVRTVRKMQIPFYQPGKAHVAANRAWRFALNPDGSLAFLLIDINTFAGLLFPPAAPDNSTVIGAAEVAGDMTTRDITTLLFNNIFLFDANPSNCCVIGFHSYDLEAGDAKNGNRQRRYVMNYSSWISNGIFSGGFEDVTAFSHEMAELFNDPFVDNATPWWLSLDPFTGAGLCQNNLETGDVVEVLSSNPVFPISMNGRTYHPQNEALFSWFAFQSPSQAHLGAYSFPDETTVTSLSPGPLHPGCTP